MAIHEGAMTRARTTADEREQIFVQLYEDHFDLVYRLGCRFGVAPSEVEDIAQKVFLVAHRRVIAGETIDNPSAWLRAITSRVVSEHRRWHRVRRVKAWLLRSTTEVREVAAPSPDRAADAARAQREIGAVLDRMSAKLRDVLVLTDVEECTPREVAEILGIPVNTVRSRRRLAREQFQALWEQRRSEVCDG